MTAFQNFTQIPFRFFYDLIVQKQFDSKDGENLIIETIVMLQFLDYVDEIELILQRVDILCTNQKIIFPMFKTHKIFFSHFQSWKFFSGNDLSSKMSL